VIKIEKNEKEPDNGKQAKNNIYPFVFNNIKYQYKNRRTEKKIDISQAVIKIDSCGLYYKGQYLELGIPVADWEKVLGKKDLSQNCL